MPARGRPGDMTGDIVAFTTSPTTNHHHASRPSSAAAHLGGGGGDRDDDPTTTATAAGEPSLSGSAIAAAFTQNLVKATRTSDSDSGSPNATAHSNNTGSADDSANLSGSLQVCYKGVKLLPGIEQLQFGDSYYLGTVDTEARMAGYGKATWVNGDEYEGEWLNDTMHGKGIYRWADGDYYRGEYEDGFMQGYGEMRDATGFYIGDWFADMRQGTGRMKYAGGNTYEGEWLGGMRHGHGKLAEASGIDYEGEFVRNEKEGKGVQTNPEGDVYDGDFSEGKPNGRGTYLWHDGAKYVGFFKDGLKHGEGCEWLPDGDWVAGNFINGEYDEGQVVRHKAIAADFTEMELGDDMEAVMEPLDAQQMHRLTSAAQAAERRAGINTTATLSTALNNNSGNAPATRHRDPTTTTTTTTAAATGDNLNGSAGYTNAESSLSSTSNATGAIAGGGGDASRRNTTANKNSERPDSPMSPFAAALRPTQLSDKDLESWTQLKIIGKGSFGAVYEALLTSGRTVCCKVVELGNVSNCEELESLKNEIALMKRMHHPNIVQYYGSCEDKEKNTINIFMELVSGGSLNSFVKKFKRIPMQTMRQWAYQMVCGVKYLHDCGIVHRDIKGDNVLVSLDGIVKLADFGCSKSIEDACSATHGCATMVGTPYWMAPEVIKCEAGGYGAKSDIWSIGCTVVEMITGKPPWPECNSMWAAVYKIANSTGLPTEIPADLDPQLMDLLSRCFERDPRKRASAAELLEHPFLAEVAEAAGGY